MPKNHAKAIKGMSIACIAIAGIIILICLAGLAMIAFFGPILEEIILDSYTYDYGYGYGYDYDSIFGAYGLTSALEPIHGHHAYYSGDFPSAYDDLGELQVMLTMFNVLLVLGLIAEGVVLAGSIIILKNHNKPEKFGMIFVWSIVGAIIGFFGSGIVQAVLFIIIAVFVNSDKKLYQAGMYFVPAPGVPGAVAYAPQQPVPPMAPVASGAPVVPAAQVLTQPAQPGQPGQPGQPVSMVQPVQIAQTAPAAEAPVQAGVAIAQATEAISADDAIVVEAAQAETAVAPEEPAPVIVDEGAVIKLDVNGDQPSEQ